jgi:hypothetical protein
MARSAGEKALARALVDAERKGWLRLLGAVRGSPADVAAVIQEHFDARVVRAAETKPGRRRHGRKKRVE